MGKLERVPVFHLVFFLTIFSFYGFAFTAPNSSANNLSVKTDIQKKWIEVEETVLPIRENTTRNATILGFARKGQILPMLDSEEHWVKIRVKDSLMGWVPKSSVVESGPPVNWSPDFVKNFLLLASGMGLGIFLFLSISIRRKRTIESLERAQQTQANAKRRLQNKIQVLFKYEPRIHSSLAMSEVDLLEYLRNLGYIANLEKNPEKFLAACRQFKPHLVLSHSEFRDTVEMAMETNALLINTPVIFMHCDKDPIRKKENRIRAYLEANATDKELGEAITIALKKSPDKILYSIKPMALNGAVNAGTILDILHFLAAVNKTGQLIIHSENSIVEILFRNGAITTANLSSVNPLEKKDKTGAEAVSAILDLSQGTFEFHEKPVEQGEGQELNTLKILMDWAREKDESNHHPRT